MASEITRNLSKVWFRFLKATKNGTLLPLRWEQLPKHRVEEFIEFKMNYHVKHEPFHVAAGLCENLEAMKEYRRYLLGQIRDTSYHHSICCVDDEYSRMVAIDSIKLYKRGDFYSEITPPQTTEMKRLCEMDEEWNNMYSVPEVLVKYGVNKLFDDAGLAIHPDFRGYRLTIDVGLLRETICKAFGVPLTGSWMTSVAVQKSSEHESWEAVYEFNTEALEKLTGVQFPNAAPKKIQYKVKRIQ